MEIRIAILHVDPDPGAQCFGSGPHLTESESNMSYRSDLDPFVLIFKNVGFCTGIVTC